MDLGNIIAAFKLILLSVACLWIGLVITRRVVASADHSLMTTLFISGFVLRIISSLIVLRVFPLFIHNHQYLSYGFVNDDGILYDQLGHAGALAMQKGLSPLTGYGFGQTSAIAYLLLVSFIYTLVGHELLALQIINSFFGAIVPIFSFVLAQKFMTQTQASWSAILISFYPEQILYSGSHQKDISIVFAFVVGLWIITKMVQPQSKRQQARNIALLLTCTIYLTLARFYYTPLLGLAFLLSVNEDGRLRKISVRRILQVGLMLFAMIGLMLLLLATVVPRGIENISTPIVAITGFYQAFTENASGSGSFYSIFRFPFNIVLFPVVVLGVLLNPFILWPFISPAAFYWVLFPSMLSWYIVLPFVVYGFWVSRQQSYGKILFYVVAAALFILIITGSGLNTAGRSKLPIQPYALMYAVLGMAAFAEGKIWVKWISGTYVTALTGIIVLYVILKLSIPLPILIFAVLPNLAIVAGIAWAYWWHRSSEQRMQQ